MIKLEVIAPSDTSSAKCNLLPASYTEATIYFLLLLTALGFLFLIFFLPAYLMDNLESFSMRGFNFEVKNQSQYLPIPRIVAI